jgi:hypothetical protein
VPQRVIGTLRCAETMDPVTKEKKKHQREEKKNTKRNVQTTTKKRRKKNQTKKQNKPVFVDGGKKRIGFVEPTVA